MQATTGVTEGYAIPNNYINSGLIEDLIATVCYMTIEDAVEFMDNLGCSAQCCYDSAGNSYNVRDIRDSLVTKHGEKGRSFHATALKGYWFYSGPERKFKAGLSGCLDHRFAIVEGSIFDFVIDAILYQVSCRGYDVFKALSLPL